MASAVRQSEVLVQWRGAQHGCGAEWSSGSLQDRRNQTGSGTRHEMTVPKNAGMSPLLVLLADGTRFAHDTLDAEGALGLRARLWLCASCCAQLGPEVFWPAGFCGNALSLWWKVIWRGGHHDSLWQGHVADGSSGRRAHLAPHAVGLSVRPVAVQVGIKHKSIFAVVSLKALPPPKEAAVVEHVLRGGIKGPVVTFARVPRLPRDLDEAVVEGQVVPDGVLPRRELVLVVRELVADEVADAAQRQLLHRALEDRHGDEGDVGVGGLHRAARSLPGRRCVCAETVLALTRGVWFGRVKLGAGFR